MERRFTEVKVPEPDKEAVLRILQEVSPEFEAKHAVVYARESLEAIYDFARIYVPNQAFPAKAIELMDEVGAEVYMQRQIQSPESQPPVIRQENLREVFRRIWGITPEGLSVDLADLLKERVVGQDHAVQELADIVITSAKRYGKERRRGPRAVILFIGPPGVGKSYTAQCLSEILFPGQNKLCTLDMTEFSGYHEAEHARFRLLGPPPPYVGWESGGLLTSHAIRNPVSVVLVDEFEKAGSAARNVFLRIFDEGWAQDGRGRIVSFREIYFILTANAGRKLWEKMKTEIGFAPPSSRGAQEAPSGVSREKIVNLLREEGFSPELLSRLSHIVRFNDLTDENLVEIARRKMSDFRDAALLEDQVLFQYDEQAFAEWLAAQCGPEKDVRRLGAVFESLVETPLAYWRTPRPEAGSVLELKPGPDRIELHPVTERDKFMRLLFVVASEAFEKKEKRWQREQAARVILGMGTSEKEVREGERKRSA